MEIHKFSELRNMADWEWCSLGEFSKEIGLKPSEILERYGSLSRLEPLFLITEGTKVKTKFIDQVFEECKKYEAMGSDVFWAIYVSAEWAHKALFEYQHGN